jgi:hypothetical protein
MVRRQKLISMTDRHFEIASEMPNFSKWVRERMDEYIQRMKDIGGESLRFYHCSTCGINFQRPIQWNRARGYHYPLEMMCSGCGGFGVRI